MISLREVSAAELEREEDCWNEMPTTKRYVPRIIVVELDMADGYEVYAAQTTSFDYSTVGVGRGKSTLYNVCPCCQILQGQ